MNEQETTQLKPARQLADGLYCVDVSLPTESPQSSQVYLVQSREGWTMIDAGWNSATAWNELQAGFDSLGISPSHLRFVILTHAHPDHVGLIARLAECSDATFVMHRAEYALAMDYSGGAMSFADTMNGFLERADAPRELMYPDQKTSPVPEVADVPRTRFLLVSGDEVLHLGERTFQLVFTPGHSCGHLSVFEQSTQSLFTGDALLGDMAPNVEFGLRCGMNPMADTLKTLQKLGGFRVQRTLPAHGGPVFDLQFSCTKLANHFLKRVTQAFETCRDGATCFQCVSESNWRFQTDIKHPGKSRIVIFQMLGYLELLVEEGLLVKDLLDGVFVYSWSEDALNLVNPLDADALGQILGL